MSAYTLPPAQQLAILLLRKSDLSLACISKLREEHAPHPSELDYITLMQAGLATKTPAACFKLQRCGMPGCARRANRLRPC